MKGPDDGKCKSYREAPQAAPISLCISCKPIFEVDSQTIAKKEETRARGAVFAEHRRYWSRPSAIFKEVTSRRRSTRQTRRSSDTNTTYYDEMFVNRTLASVPFLCLTASPAITSGPGP
jgi:hypothetical protein